MEAERLADSLSFGDLLRRYRLAAGLTQEALAERSGLSVRGISDLERGARTHPQQETVKLLIAALDVTGEERAALLRAARRPLAPLRDPLAATAMSTAFPDAPLPFTGTPLIGREEAVAALATLLADPATRLVTLLGTAGIGKTRLAVAVAERCQASFPDGVAFVPLAPLTDPALVPGAVARALGMRESGAILGEKEIARALGDRRVLLVLDNLEQLLPAAAPWVSQLFVACPTVTVLATSRVPLRLTVERRFPITPLGLPAAADAEIAAVRESSAVQLFVERAQAISPDFTLTSANAGDVAAICRHLDGLPLAIELAAARVSLLAPHALLRRLERRLPLLTGGMRDAPERHQTLRQAIAWSYDLLSPNEQSLFRRLGVFVGGWTPEAATAIDLDNASENFELLAALVEQNLVVPVSGNNELRFTMLETIREFALEQLALSEEEEKIRDRHAAFYLQFAETAGPHLEMETQIEWVARLEAEHANIRAAIERFTQQGRSSEILRIGGALWISWFDRHPAEGLAWLEAALAVPGADLPVRAVALHGAGNLARNVGNPHRGQEFHLEELALRRSIGDEEGIGKTLLPLGVEAYELDELARAEVLLVESVQRLCGTADTWKYGIALRSLAGIAVETGRYDLARELLKEALEVSETRNDHSEIAQSFRDLGWAAKTECDYPLASKMLRKSLRFWRDQAYPEFSRTRDCLEEFADVAIANHDLLRAESLLAEASSYASEAWLGPKLSLLQGRLARLRGERRIAALAYGRVHSLVCETRYRQASEAVAYFSELAAFCVALRQFEPAMRLLGTAVGLRETIGVVISPHERKEHERVVAAIENQLGPTALEEAVVQTRGVSREEMIAAGLNVAADLLASVPQLVPEGERRPDAPKLRIVSSGRTALVEEQTGDSRGGAESG